MESYTFLVRGVLEIKAAILEAIEKAHYLTRKWRVERLLDDTVLMSKIVLHARISHKMLTGYIKQLVTNGLISIEVIPPARRKKRATKIVHITEKGRNFLSLYREMNDLLYFPSV